MSIRIRDWCFGAAVAWTLAGAARAQTVAAAPATAPADVTTAAFAIRAWETDDGLPRNSVIALTQTQDGYLWLGTLNGLVRFDGRRFSVYDTSNTPGLEGNRVVSLFEDRDAGLWLGFEDARAVLVRPDGIRPLKLGGPGRARRLTAACQDETGAVWLYTADGELARHLKGDVNVWRLAAERPSQYRDVVAESGGPVWVAVDRGLYEIDATAVAPRQKLPVQQMAPFGRVDRILASRRGGCWRLVDGRIERAVTNRVVATVGRYPWGNPATPVSAACEDAAGNLIVGTLGDGVYWFNAAGQARHFSTAEGLSNDYILSLTVDREGSLWVGTDGGGLNRIRRELFHVLEPTRDRVVQAVAEDPEGGVWVGYNGGGLDHLRDGEVRSYEPETGFPGLPVRALLTDRAGVLWVGLWGGGLVRRLGERFERVSARGLMHPIVRVLHEDRAGNLWVGTEGGLIRRAGDQWRRFTTADGLTSNRIQALADDAAGNLWIGTVDAGLNRLRDGAFSHFRAAPDGLPGDAVSALHVDAEGTLWVGTDGHGLARFRDGHWARFTTGEGLPGNSIGAIQEDDTGGFWISTASGLLRVDRADLEAVAAGRTHRLGGRVYEKADGLPSRECTIAAGLDVPPPAAGGRLWVPTIKGLGWVTPAAVRPNPYAPPVVIESVVVEGRPQGASTLRAPAPEKIVVPPGAHRLEIHYTSLNLAAPERARFRYRLVGHDDTWTDAADIRTAFYSKLPPGDYRFEVAAANEDGVWSRTSAHLALHVLPPFWRTWWFLCLTGAAVLGGLGATVHYASTQRLRRQVARLREQEALEKERARIARDLHDQLGASLTQVALLGELAESDKDCPEEVEAHARQISQTARDTTRVLDEIVWAVNPSNDTVDSLITYCCKNAQEYFSVAGLRYRQEVPDTAPATPVPPEVRHNVFLAAKEAVTNVVRHARATEARIRVQVEDDAFTLEIRDNGRGPGDIASDRAKTRNGLRNMRRRMEEAGGSFEIGPAPDGGTRVCLRVPLPQGRNAGK